MENSLRAWLDFAVQQLAAESYLDQFLQGRQSLLSVLSNGNNNADLEAEQNFRGKSRFVSLSNIPGALEVRGTAEEFANRYQIVSHHSNDASGFSGTLLLDKSSSTYTLSFRSTEYRNRNVGGDYERDGVGVINNRGADSEILGFGFALGQLLAMEQYFEEVKAILPPAARINVTGYSLGGHLATVFTALHSTEVIATYTFNGAGRGNISGGGGAEWSEAERIRHMLIRMKSILVDPSAAFPDPQSSAEIVALFENAKGLAQLHPEWNPFEAGSLENLYLDPRYLWARYAVVREFSPSFEFDRVSRSDGAFGKIVQIVGHATSGDTEYTANSQNHAAATQVYIEDQPDFDGFGGFFDSRGDFGTSHSITLIIDSLALQDLFLSIDPTLTQKNIEQIFSGSSAQHARGSVFLNGEAEGNSLEYALDALYKVITGKSDRTPFDRSTGGFGDIGNRTIFYQHMEEIRAASASLISPLKIETVFGKSALELVAEATNPDPTSVRSRPFRYALMELNPFVVLNANYMPHGATGELDIYVPETGVGKMSMQWIRDRASLLVALNAAKIKNNINVSGQHTGATGTTVYSSHDASGGRITIIPTGLVFSTNYVSFDSDEGNLIFGGNQDDRLYGAGGNDVLEGFNGRDWLEGGKGDDELKGGSGEDELYGGEGRDFLYGDGDMDVLDGGRDPDHMEGGRGSDRLFGRGGDDTLDGGEGSDWLDGGEGLDIYVFRNGDGVDTIADHDGLGRIVINGRSVVSPVEGFRRIGNFWMSEGSRDPYSFHLDGSMAEGGVLTITGLFHGQIRIENFSNGDLGILLSDVFADIEPIPGDVIEFGSNVDPDSLGTNGVDHAVAGSNYGIFFGLRGDDVLGDVGNVTYYATRIYGNAGNDWLIGSDVDFDGHGGDALIGGGGADLIFGGAGSDALWGDGWASFSADGFEVDGFRYWLRGYEDVGGVGRFYDQSTNHAIEDVVFHFEGGFEEALHWILGTTEGTDLSAYFNDYLEGGSGNDLIYGMAGSDELYGGDGNDTLVGDVDETQFGVRIEPGANLQLVKFLGQYGNDYLDGGAGNDKLTDFTAGSDVLMGGEGDDILENFESRPNENNILSYAGSLAGNESFNNHLDGGSGDDRLRSSNHYAGSHDELYGGSGNDVIVAAGMGVQFDIFAGEGNDEITAGSGKFRIDGGIGNDVYRMSGVLFSAYHVEAVITDEDFAPGNQDRIELILLGTIGDLSLTRKADDLFIGFLGARLDLITISNWFAGPENKIEQFIITCIDSQLEPTVVVWDAATIERLTAWVGTAGPDILVGGDGDDTIRGDNGEDGIYSGNGNDHIAGGLGDDELNGGGGDDAYYFSPGDGIDSIKDSGGIDVLTFEDGITVDMVLVSFVNDELRIAIGSDLISLQWQPLLGYQIELIKFADGQTWDAATLMQMAAGENDSPVVDSEIPDQVCIEDEKFVFRIPGNTFDDDSGDEKLRISAILSTGLALPSWLSFNPDTGLFSGTPGNADVGAISVKVIATDTEGASVFDLFDLRVSNTNDSPILLLPIDDQIAVDETPYSLGIPGNMFEDPDIGDQLVYSAFLQSGAVLPAWLSFDSTNGMLFGTPSSLDIGSFNVTVTATDSVGAVMSDQFEIVVNPYPNLTLLGDASSQQLVGKSGADILNGGAGIDVLIGKRGDDTYFVDDFRDLVVEVEGEGNDLLCSPISYTLPQNVENLTLTGGKSISGTGNSLDNVVNGNSGANVLKGMAGSDFIGGGNGDDYIYGGDGNDVLIGEADNDDLYGDAGADCLQGNTGADHLYGGLGQDILQGGGQNDYLHDIDGSGVLDGGDGSDSLLGENGQKLFLGGKGDDLIAIGSGGNLIAFNAHDGKDIVLPATNQSALSLGGGISFADLQFIRSTWDLVLKIGLEDQITFKHWYTKKNDTRIGMRLQMIIEASPDYDSAGNNTLLDNKVETFDLATLASAFDAGGQVNNWALTNALLDAHLSGSDTAAIGGDLAYQYGLNGSLAGIGLAAARDVLNTPQFATTSQTLQSLQDLKQGQIRLQ